jgi:hypothetical protein
MYGDLLEEQPISETSAILLAVPFVINIFLVLGIITYHFWTTEQESSTLAETQLLSLIDDKNISDIFSLKSLNRKTGKSTINFKNYC